MKRKGKRKPIGKRGNLFWDEGANQNLIKPTQETGFKVHPLPKEYRNTRLPDSTLMSKIMKGNMPIVTDDGTQYTQTNKTSKATGFIEHDTVSEADFEAYKVKWQKFLNQHTSTSLAGFRWEVPFKGGIIKIPLSSKK